MEDPSLYNHSNNLQRRDTENFLLNNEHLLKEVGSGSDIIDIGCGDGYVTSNILKKYLPEDFKTLTGVDRSSNMVEFAGKTYGSSEIFFKVMNFDQDPYQDMKGKFHVLTSFYCFHWLIDVKKTIKNIHNLLDKGGMCLFMFPIQHPTFEVYKYMMTHQKWADVVGDGTTNKCVPTMGEVQDLEDEYYVNLVRTGFRRLDIKTETKYYRYTSMEKFIDFFKSVNPFLKLIPEDRIQEMCDDMMDIYSRCPLVDMIRGKDGKVVKSVMTTYKLLAISAFK